MWRGSLQGVCLVPQPNLRPGGQTARLGWVCLLFIWVYIQFGATWRRQVLGNLDSMLLHEANEGRTGSLETCMATFKVELKPHNLVFPCLLSHREFVSLKDSPGNHFLCFLMSQTCFFSGPTSGAFFSP